MRFIFSLTLFTAIVFSLTPTLSYAEGKPVKVFILAGQSNMVGSGGMSDDGRNPDFDPEQPKSKTNPEQIKGGLGSLRWFVNNEPKTWGPGGTKALVDAEGKWLVRSDVQVYAHMEVFKDKKNPGQLTKGITRTGPLGIGFGRSVGWIGPEYGIGTVLGNAIDEDILLIKVATGGTSLAQDWLSPTAVKHRGGVNENAAEVGYMWNHMVGTVQQVLDNLGTEFPDYKGRAYEIAGFAWHQGYNDNTKSEFQENYEQNLTDLITDVRAAYGEDLPIVIGTTSMYPPHIAVSPVELAQLAVGKADPLTTTVDTSGFWRDKSESPSGFGHHWNHNGMTYYEVGESMGQAMLTRLKPTDAKAGRKPSKATVCLPADPGAPSRGAQN